MMTSYEEFIRLTREQEQRDRAAFTGESALPPAVINRRAGSSVVEVRNVLKAFDAELTRMMDTIKGGFAIAAKIFKDEFERIKPALAHAAKVLNASQRFRARYLRDVGYSKMGIARMMGIRHRDVTRLLAESAAI